MCFHGETLIWFVKCLKPTSKDSFQKITKTNGEEKHCLKKKQNKNWKKLNSYVQKTKKNKTKSNKCKKTNIHLYAVAFCFPFFFAFVSFFFLSQVVGGNFLAHTYHTAIQLPKGISPDIHGLGSVSQPLTNEDAHPNPRLIVDAQWNHPNQW